MRELEVLDRGHLKLDWEERKEFFEDELNERVRSEVKRLLEQALEAERTARLAVGRYVRDTEARCDYRNGYYRRDLGTRLGLLIGLRVPRTRHGGGSQLLPRNKRRQESVHGLVREAFLRGISTPHAHWILGFAYLRKRAFAEAIAEFQRAIALSPNVTEYKAGLGYAYGRAGKSAEARKLLSELQEQSKRTYVSSCDFAVIYAGLGEKDQAFAFLEKAYEQRDTKLVPWGNVNPLLDPLRSDRRFQDLLRRVGLPP